MWIIFWVFCLILGNDHGNFALRQVRSMVGDFKNHPYFVHLRSQSNICAGSLIAQNSILTSANCCLSLQCDLTLAMSGYNKVEKVHDQAASCKEYRIHPQYKAGPDKVGQNDLCVMSVHKPFKLTLRTQLVKLGTTDDYKAMLKKGVAEVIGYGDDHIYVGELGIWSKYEMEIFFHLNARVYQDCKAEITEQEFKREFDTENMFCTKGVKFHCIGDSGGPVMFNEVQVGVAVWGWETCRKIRFTVHTRLDTYMDFINISPLSTYKSTGHTLKNIHSIALYVGAILIYIGVPGTLWKACM